ncbi:hypothetical protein DFH07DRAFT_439771 [Mycena maculata]|uniref:Uncharacterized protein n=1 Tax=Mycena maculata TaxID=230809 RepID=A0AAD7K8X7_9AGAR|nr:hypothetical protein DFH07DRAFT_439771 [Mycena maculata]
MRFSTVVLFTSSLASTLATPALFQPQTVDSLVSKASIVITHLTQLTALGTQIAKTPSSAPEIPGAVEQINSIVGTLVPVEAGGLLDELLDSILGGGGGLGLLLGGDQSIVSGLLPGNLLGGLLDGNGLLGGDLLTGLLNGVLGGLLGGGLLGGLLSGGGLLVSISGLLEVFPGLGASCGTDLVSELLGVVQSLVASLTSIVPDAQGCDCEDDETLRAGVAALIKSSQNQLAPIH